MKGGDLRAFREARGLNQGDLAQWLNERMGRRYDKQRISKWENDSERIPQAVMALLRQDVLGPEPKVGPAYVASVTNQKGGVGKTVTTVNTATVLARRGYKTLLIDADPQANATMHLGIDAYALEEQGKTLHYAFAGSVPLSDIIVTMPESGLHVAPSCIRLAETEVQLMLDPAGAHALTEILASVRNDYDFILLDTPPNIGQLTINALTASHGALVPCQTERFSVVGMRFLFSNIDKIRRRTNPGLTVVGIVPSMYQARQINDRTTLQQIQEEYSGLITVFPPIPKVAVYAQATTIGKSLIDAAPDSPGASVYEAIATVLIHERTNRLEKAHVA